LTLNNQEWLDALAFSYHDVKLGRVAYVHNYGETMTDEERQAAWLAEEAEEVIPEDTPEEEVKKREEEKVKKA